MKSIKIENLRCFREAELNLQYPGRELERELKLPNINLLLGDNGAGKTTVLRAIALASLFHIMPQSGFVPYYLVRREKPQNEQPDSALIRAEVLLNEQDLESRSLGKSQSKIGIGGKIGIGVVRHGDSEILMRFDPAAPSSDDWLWDPMFVDNSPAFLVVGYGASRRVEDSGRFDESARRKSRLLRYERVAGLFESYITLTPLESWLPNFKKENPGRHKQVVNLIDRLLLEGASFAGDLEKGEYLFEMGGAKIPFGALSDGYRAYIGWIADLLYHICRGAPSGAKLVETRGIVLVDEIDLHLHPEWQRSVIPTISEALPNLQFVLTTHSPIVAGSLYHENIFVMETDKDGSSRVRQYEEKIYGRSAEEILLSSYFDLKTTRAEPFVDELRDLSVKAGKGDLKAALAFMEKLAGQPEDATDEDAVKGKVKSSGNGRRKASAKSGGKARGKPSKSRKR